MQDKKYHHGNLKEALIEAGLEILAESGLDGLSLRTCAARVGVSHTAPKNHFGNMSGLLTAIAARGYGQLAEWMRRDLPDHATRQQIRDFALEGYVAFARAQPALFELMFSGGRTNRDDPDLKAAVGTCFEVLRTASQNLDWDKADAPDAELRAQIMSWSLVHGFAQLALAGKLDKAATKSLGILDVVPDFGFRDQARDGEP